MTSQKLFYPILLLLLAPIGLLAQDGKYTADKSSSKMSVLGTSTLHDWESTVDNFSVTATVEGSTLVNVVFTADVKSIKSGKSGMDKNTYDALNADDHPQITFKADKLTVAAPLIKGSGQLTIAGVTKTVQMDLKYEQWSEGSYQIIGEIPLKMTDYGVTPPTAMLGTIKTGDDVTIKFEISMNR